MENLSKFWYFFLYYYFCFVLSNFCVIWLTSKTSRCNRKIYSYTWIFICTWYLFLRVKGGDVFNVTHKSFGFRIMYMNLYKHIFKCIILFHSCSYIQNWNRLQISALRILQMKLVLKSEGLMVGLYFIETLHFIV